MSEPFLNVKDFGAIGDGQVDDEPAISMALAAAVSQNSGLNPERRGGTVCLPAGVYRCGKGLILPPRVRLLGSGRNTSVISAGNAKNFDLITADGNEWGLEHLGLAGGRCNLVNFSGHEIRLVGLHLWNAAESAWLHDGSENLIGGHVEDVEIECQGSRAGLEIGGPKQFSDLTLASVVFRGSSNLATGGQAILDRNGVQRLHWVRCLLQGPFPTNRPAIDMGNWLSVWFDGLTFADFIQMQAGVPLVRTRAGTTSRLITFCNTFATSAANVTFGINGPTRSWAFYGGNLGGRPTTPSGAPAVNAFSFAPNAYMEAEFHSCEFSQNDLGLAQWRRAEFYGANSPRRPS